MNVIPCSCFRLVYILPCSYISFAHNTIFCIINKIKYLEKTIKQKTGCSVHVQYTAQQTVNVPLTLVLGSMFLQPSHNVAGRFF